MTRPRRRDRRLPARPYRDSALAYGLMAVVGFFLLVVSGRSAGFALAVMLGCFLAAMAWSWWRFRTKLQQRGRR